MDVSKVVNVGGSKAAQHNAQGLSTNHQSKKTEPATSSKSLRSSSNSAKPTSTGKQQQHQQPLSEDDLVSAITDFAMVAREAERKHARKMEFTQSDEDLYETVRFGDGLEMVAAAGDTIHEFPDGLMILASCIPPGPSAEMADSERLERLSELIESAGGNASKIGRWTVGRGKNQVPYFITETGSKLRNNMEVGTYLDFNDLGLKLAELMDYLEERHVAFHPKDWRIDERRKTDGKRSGFSFVFRENGRTFYARNKVADYLELRQIMPASRNAPKGYKKRKDEKAASVADEVAVSASNASSKPKSKKKRHVWKAGTSVRVDYEGVIYDALIVPTPQGLPEIDSEEDERMVSVFYIQEECFEHGVLQSRIIRERPSTEIDQNVMRELENGALNVDADIRQSTAKQNKGGSGTKVKSVRNLKAAKKDGKDKKRPRNQAEEEPDDEEAEAVDRKRMRAAMRASQPQEAGGEDGSDPALSPEQRAEEYLDTVKQRIGSTTPKLFMTFIGMMTEYNRGRVQIQELVDFVVDAFGEDDTDLVIKFNMFLPDPAKITPQYVRRRLAFVASNGSGSAAPEPTMGYDAFLALVGSRFNNDPSAISRFRELMARYQQDQDVGSLAKDAEHLFAGHSDILNGLNFFLPSEYKIKI